MATIAAPQLDVGTRERRFYTRYALFMVLMAFIGFAPSFYLHGLFSYPRPNPTLPWWVILHGSLFTAWLAVFVAQTQLVAAGRRDIHMKLGSASMLLALAIVPLMYLVAVWQVARANQPPFTTALDWTIVPLLAIPEFVIMLWIGWSKRRQPQWHKRMMLGASLVMMGPAIGRFPIAPPTIVGFAFLMSLAFLTYVPMMVWDYRTRRELHPATKIAVAIAAVVTVLRVGILATGSWAPVAAHLPGVDA